MAILVLMEDKIACKL